MEKEGGVCAISAASNRMFPSSASSGDQIRFHKIFSLTLDLNVGMKTLLAKQACDTQFGTRPLKRIHHVTHVAELLLIREPERRFYRECRLAGFDETVYDESSGEEQVFDVGQLRLRFGGRSFSPGWKPRLDGRQDALRYNSRRSSPIFQADTQAGLG